MADHVEVVPGVPQETSHLSGMLSTFAFQIDRLEEHDRPKLSEGLSCSAEHGELVAFNIDFHGDGTRRFRECGEERVEAQ